MTHLDYIENMDHNLPKNIFDQNEFHTIFTYLPIEYLKEDKMKVKTCSSFVESSSNDHIYSYQYNYVAIYRSLQL